MVFPAPITTLTKKHYIYLYYSYSALLAGIYIRYLVFVLLAFCGGVHAKPANVAIPATVLLSYTNQVKQVATEHDAKPPMKLLYRIYKNGRKPLLLVFAEAFAGGLIAVFTPYVYAFVPMTMSTLLFRTAKKGQGRRNTALFSMFLVLIFTTLGGLISLLAGSTGIIRLSGHWLFNLFFFRLLAGLGLSLIGAFDISLPLKVIRHTQGRAQANTLSGLFFMALTLPVVTFSSTMPMMGLALVLAGKGGVFGPVVGMLGFASGLCVPFIYPRLINLMPASALNYIKVFMGFIALVLSLKFFSNADVSQGWHILDREIFVIICILFALVLAAHMLGFLRLSNDYSAPQNVYGQAYVSIPRLMMAIAAFMLAIYMLSGVWGAPLHGISLLLPPLGY